MADQGKSIFQHLSDIQGLLPAFNKDSKAHKYNYVSLDNINAALKPLLAERELSLTSSVRGEVGLDSMFLTTCLRTKQLDSGNEIAVEVPMMLGSLRNGNAMQDMGSAITYARRYALSIMFNLETETDDDGQKLTPQKTAGRKPAPAKKKIDSGLAVFHVHFKDLLAKCDPSKRSEALALAKDGTSKDDLKKAIEFLEVLQ